MPIWVAVFAALVLLHLLQWALLPFVLGSIIAFVTDPAVRWIGVRTKTKRWVGAIGLYLLLLAFVAALAVAVGISAWRDLNHLAATGLGPARATLIGLLGPGGRDLFGIHLSADGLLAGVKGKLHAILRPDTLQHLATVTFGGVVGLFLTALVSFYLMLSGPRLALGALRLAPPSWRGPLKAELPEVVRIVQRYFIGVLCVVAFTALAAWIGYGLVLHIKGAAVLALVVGVLETIPLIGPVLAACLVALAATQLKSAVAVFGMVAYAVALRLIVDDVIAPIVLGRSVALNPVVVMLAYVVGAALFGVAGLLLAVPAAACINVAARATYREHSLS